MALSMEERRILAQIEERLASADPELAARLSAFGRGRATWASRKLRRARTLRTARLLSGSGSRVRVAGSVIVLAVVTLVSLVVYALVPFRDAPGGGGNVHRPSPAGHPMMTVPGGTASSSAAPPSTGPSRLPPRIP
jgi:hypothetical protein